MNRFGKLRLGKPTIGKPEDSLKKLVETRKSYDDALRSLYDNPLGKPFDIQGPTEALIKSVEDLRASANIQRRLSQINSFVETLQQSIDVRSQLEEALKFSVTHATVGEFVKALDMQRESIKALKYIADPYIPELQQIDYFAEEFARHVEPFKDIYSSISDWQSSLNSRMESLRTPWILPNIFDKPMVGFARLSRLSDAAHTAEPYSPSVVELVSDELGSAIEILSGESANGRDSAAVRAGLKPELIAFPPDAYGKVVIAAGFEFHFTEIQAPQAVESGDRDAEFHWIHWRIFTELEQSIRYIVEKTLMKLDGTNWIRRRVPEPIRKRWKERQEEDRSFERPVYAPIQYADFMDLADIVGKSDNWDEAFKPIFRNREDFIASLRRLHPVRKAIAHSRPLGRADVLTLVTESTRIFSFLGIRVLR